MPNWCENKVTIVGTKEKVDACERIKADFDRMFKTPRELLKMGAPILDGDVKQANLVRFGSTDWYNWRKANWGTKWAIPDSDVTTNRLDEITLELRYATAWSPPFEFYRRQSELLDIRIEVEFFEPGCDFCGEQHFDKGEILMSNIHTCNKADYEKWGYEDDLQ